MSDQRPPWPHAPSHQLGQRGTYFLTAATYHKQHHFRGANRLAVLQRGLLKLAIDYGWRLEAWAVFSNHYHFVGQADSGETADNLVSFLQELHSRLARWVNKMDRCSTRQVWHNYRDTRLTYERSYLARLNYVHQNAVKHRLVPVANQYPWCSASWLERVARPAQVKTIYSFDRNQVNVADQFEIHPDC